MGVEGQARNTLSSFLLQTEAEHTPGPAFPVPKASCYLPVPLQTTPSRLCPAGKPSCACVGSTLKWGPHNRDAGLQGLLGTRLESLEAPL